MDYGTEKKDFFYFEQFLVQFGSGLPKTVGSLKGIVS
jgi:hypothetical protein